MDTAFKLSVWRPARSDRPTMYAPAGGNGSQWSASGGLHHEEIYSWHPGEESPWTALTLDDAVAAKNELVATFAADRPPSARSLSAFAAIVRKLRVQLEAEEYDGWSLAQGDPAVIEAQGDIDSLRIHALRALLLHFDWVVAVFSDVPGASVTIR